MEQRIVGYKLKLTEIQILKVPEHSKILCLKMANRCPHIYIIENIGNRLVDRKIEIITPGQALMEVHNRYYIGSCLYEMPGVEMDIHVFELLPKQ